MAKTKKSAPAKAAARAARAARKVARATRVNTGSKAERKAHRMALKLEKRKQQKKEITAEEWAAPAPAHLVARPEAPRLNTKYKTYYEILENTTKKKKLEFEVTNQEKAPPGFKFVPIGDPALTSACKELSREKGAMIFIVSSHKEMSKISEQVHRTGYHFREVIVDEAREIVGETVISRAAVPPGFIEPIPNTQEEINRQADAAIRDLFPRIPNIDRTMIIDHAFKLGALFHGDKVVGLQPEIPLSRRVQLATLAHIRHTHTRYDKLLRETSWLNARKVVEPVCLDIIVKWRGDEETGRDQLEDIIREVVVITDTEESEESSSESDSSDDDEDSSSVSSTELPVNRQRLPDPIARPRELSMKTSERAAMTVGATSTVPIPTGEPLRRGHLPTVKGAHRGFKRYQAAWDEALHRTQERPPLESHRIQMNAPLPTMGAMVSRSTTALPEYDEGHIPPRQLRLQLSELYHRDSLTDDFIAPPSEPIRTEYQHPPARSFATNPFNRHDKHGTRVNEPNTYYGNASHSSKNSSHEVGRPRLSQVVQVPSSTYGLQDMLLRSVETPSRDAHSTYAAERIEPMSDWDRENRARAIQPQGRNSPHQREVIVIDDSPHVKRRRIVVHEDEQGNFRTISPREITQTRSHQFASALPAPVLRNDSGLVASNRSTQESWNDSTADERLPVYDAPESGFFTAHPRQLGRPEVSYDSFHTARSPAIQPSTLPRFETTSEMYHHQPSREYRSAYGDQTMNHIGRGPEPEYHRVFDARRHPSPGFHNQNRNSGSYRSVVPRGGDISHQFSQSFLDDSPLRVNEGLKFIGNSYTSAPPHGSLQENRYHPTSFTASQPPPRPPMERRLYPYTERPL